MTRLRLLLLHAQFDVTVRIGILGGIVQQVGQHLREPQPVRLDARQIVGDLDYQRVAPGIERGLEVSTAASTTERMSSSSRRNSSVPRVTRETSSRSSSSRAMW